MSEKDTVNVRAGKFFHDLANAEHVSVNVRTPARTDAPVGFAKSLKVAIPALLLTAAAHAQTDVPPIAFQVNDSALEQVQSIESMVEQAMHLMRDAAPVLPLMKECLNEFYDKHPEADRDEASFFFQGGADALKNYLEISQWASHYNRDVKLGVAAYCQDPTDWQGVVIRWDEKSEFYQNSSFPNRMIDSVFTRQANRAQTVYGAVQTAAFYQESNANLAHQVNGFDWVGAAASLGAGAASLFGANETAKLINGAERDASQGERIYRSAERAGNAQGARKYDRIGNVMEQAGRWINRPSRDRQTSSTRRPTY